MKLKRLLSMAFFGKSHTYLSRDPAASSLLTVPRSDAYPHPRPWSSHRHPVLTISVAQAPAFCPPNSLVMVGMDIPNVFLAFGYDLESDALLSLSSSIRGPTTWLAIFYAIICAHGEEVHTSPDELSCPLSTPREHPWRELLQQWQAYPAEV
jgi:hypothetical protein